MFPFVTNSIKKVPLKKVLFWSYILFITMIIACLCIFFYFNSVNITMNETNKYTYRILNELNNRINSFMTEMVNLSFFLSEENDLIYYVRSFPEADNVRQLELENDIKGLINGYWMSRSEIMNINVLIKGKKYTSSGHNSVYSLEHVENSEWFKKLEGVDNLLLETNKAEIDRTGMISETSFNNTITTISKIKDAKGNAFGYVVLDMSVDYLYKKLLLENKVSPGSEIYVVNSQGTIVVAQDSEKIGVKMHVKPVNDIIKSSVGGYKLIRYNGKDTLLVYTTTSKQGWKMVELIPVKELYAGVKMLKTVVITVAIIAIVLAALVSSYLAGVITQPIIILASTMKKFRMENIREYVANDFTNELGELNASYNTMLEKIEKLIDETNHSNELKRQADIKALQAQINPHLLYNTLDSISWSALSKNVPEISEMVSMLSKLYRLNLSKGSSICRVSEEINHVKYYMDIQKLCFMNRFDYFIEIDAEAEDLYIPKLILQPLAENAIIHGFATLKKRGEIRIQIHGDGDQLHLEVKDNGRGMPEELLSQLIYKDSRRQGYGIKNINERIGFICGKQYGIQYHRGEEEGIVAEIVLPIVSNLEHFKNV